MGNYINEADAIAQIETVAKEVTNDYKLFVRNRLSKQNELSKYVEFALILLPSDAEPIFNKLAKLRLTVCQNKILELTSSVYLDEAQRTIKEMILIKTKVNI